MKFKIRTKLIIAFSIIIFPFLLIVGITAIYNMSQIHKAVQRLDAITKEMKITSQIPILIDRAIMPGNDYIITGDRKYIEDFKNVSGELEREMDKIEGVLMPSQILTAEEKEIIKDFKSAWQNIKEISYKIFAIPDPVGNKDAAKLMEEMDYKWTYPAIERLKRWHEIDEVEYKEAMESVYKAWGQSWIIMSIGVVVMMVSGAGFAIFYSKRLTTPIITIHERADAIAKGDFNARLDIKTGDELQGLSEAMNEMAGQLESLYSYIGGKVEMYRSITETSNDAVICIGAPDTIILWNKRAEEMFGYSADEAIGSSMHDIIVPERYREKSREGLKIFFETGTGPLIGKTIGHVALRRDGTEFPIEISIIGMKIQDKWQAAGIIRDITERKKAEEELIKRIEELELFRKVTIKRELRMEELKKRIKELEEELKILKGIR
jgi:PAS domain S-box-containing protein